MKTISFMIAKGGVGKTVSSVNFAYILSSKYNKRVLLIDLDPQGNASKAMSRFDEDELSVSNLLTDKGIDVRKTIKKTDYPNIDVITANLSLVQANQKVLLDVTTVQQTRLKKHLNKVCDEYDYCIFDCPTDINMSTLNAFVCTQDVMIPVRVDLYSFDAVTKVLDIIEDMRDFNPELKLTGSFVTMYQKNNLNRQGIEELHKHPQLKTFDTPIRYTIKVSESTYDKPLCHYAPFSTAAQDYYSIVEEYLQRK